MGRNRRRIGVGVVAEAVQPIVAESVSFSTPEAYIKKIDDAISKYSAVAHYYANLSFSQRKEREALLDEARNAIDQMQREVSYMTQEQQQALVDSPDLHGEVMAALAFYGTPDIRMQVVKKAFEAYQLGPESGRDKYNDTATHTHVYDDGTEETGTFDITKELYYMDMSEWIVRNTLEGDMLVSENNPSWGTGDEDLLPRLFLNHGSHREWTSQWAAQWQNAMMWVGPNADVPRDKIPSFFPRGVKPPEPNPKIIALLNTEYRRVQEELKKRKITAIPLYRGSSVLPGIPLEPWSASKRTASDFKRIYEARKARQQELRRQRLSEREYFLRVSELANQADEPVIRTAKIPAKYVLGRWDITPHWPEERLRGKKEHMIAGLAYAYDTGILPDF